MVAAGSSVGNPCSASQARSVALGWYAFDAAVVAEEMGAPGIEAADQVRDAPGPGKFTKRIGLRAQVQGFGPGGVALQAMFGALVIGQNLLGVVRRAGGLNFFLPVFCVHEALR